MDSCLHRVVDRRRGRQDLRRRHRRRLADRQANRKSFRRKIGSARNAKPRWQRHPYGGWFWKRGIDSEVGPRYGIGMEKMQQPLTHEAPDKQPTISPSAPI
jgi:hypothetical protein